MAFKYTIFFIGILVGIILSLLFRRVSLFEATIFDDKMTVDEAKKMHDDAVEKLSKEHEEKAKDVSDPKVAEQMAKELQDNLIKLSSDLNTFMTKKSFQAQPEAPAAQAAPEAPAAQTSTFKSESYY